MAEDLVTATGKELDWLGVGGRGVFRVGVEMAMAELGFGCEFEGVGRRAN